MVPRTGDIGSQHCHFIQRLMERFDKKDPEIHFRDLAQLKQTGNAENFISNAENFISEF